MSDPHRIAIIGIGAIGSLHARAISELDNAVVVAGSCRTPEKGRQFAEEFNCHWYPDVAQMLDQVKPDLVTIATPSGAHLDGALLAVERGIHVLCEKPMEITTQRCDRMIAAAEKAGVVLGGIFPQRFNPVVRAIHDAAQAGRFGSVATVSAYVPWWRDDKYYAPDRWQGTIAMDGGGALMNQSIHAIDAMQWIAAAGGCGSVAEVFGYTARRGHEAHLIEVEDTAVAALRYESGALGIILGCTSMYPGAFQRMHIGGRDGSAEVHEESLVTWHFRHAKEHDAGMLDRYRSGTSGGGVGDPLAIEHGNHMRNIADFLATLDAGRPPLIDGREARKSLAIVEAIYESAHTGKPVQPT